MATKTKAKKKSIATVDLADEIVAEYKGTMLDYYVTGFDSIEILVGGIITDKENPYLKEADGSFLLENWGSIPEYYNDIRVGNVLGYEQNAENGMNEQAFLEKLYAECPIVWHLRIYATTNDESWADYILGFISKEQDEVILFHIANGGSL